MRLASEAAQDEITREERRALLERIAESTQIKRAARLCQFLLYVGRRSIDEGSTSIHEQEIGAFVFGRPSGYDTNQDNIVRVNATELRKRLEAYFALEGAHEQVVLHIPRGSYTPVFNRRLPAETAPLMATETVASPPVPVSSATDHVGASSAERPHRDPRILQASVVVLLIACGLLLWHNVLLRRQVQPWKNSPALASFWSSFLGTDHDTDIIVADTSFSLAEDISKRLFTLDDYMSYAYKDVTQSPALSMDQRTDIRLVLDRSNGSFGDFQVAQQILALDPLSPKLKLQFARGYSPDAIKRDNAILIGSSQSNPWVDLFEPQLNFSMHYDAVRHAPFIVNHHPQAGEKSVYDGSSGAPNGNGYSIIAFVPNLNRSGDILILEGTGSQATDAAGDFITSEPRLSKLRSTAPHGPFPYFEILLRTSHLVGTSLHSEVISYRTYPRNSAGAFLPSAYF